MRDLKEVQAEYWKLIGGFKIQKEVDDLKPRERSALNKRAAFLSFVIKYLQSNPSEEKLNKERSKLMLYLESIDPRFEEWRDNTPKVKEMSIADSRKLYYKLMGKQRKEKQLRTINYILGK